MFGVLHEYVTQGILGLLKQYIQDLDRRDAEVSLWAGGLTLNNVVLRPNVARRALRLPVTVTSGRIHQLRVHVPIKFMSEPVTVTINTIEVVLSLDDDAAANLLPIPANLPDNTRETGEGAEGVSAGYMAGLMRKIVSNISVKVNHLILKLVDEDASLSLNIEELQLNSTDRDWVPAFTDVETSVVMRRLLNLRDLTLCLDRRTAAGNITKFQDPLLYRCNLMFRITSHRTRPRATCTLIQLVCTDLSLSISCAQLPMLHRLLVALSAARAAANALQEAAARARRRDADNIPAQEGEQVGGGSWSAWAWSWVPWSGAYDEAGPEGAAQAGGASRALLLTILAHKLTMSFKASEHVEGPVQRWRTRCVLKLFLERAALVMRSWDNNMETFLGIRTGTRTLRLEADGPCICGHPSPRNEVYLRSLEPEDEHDDVEGTCEGQWPAMAASSIEAEAEGEDTAARSACPPLAITFTRRLRRSTHISRNKSEKNDEQDEIGGEEGESEEQCTLVVHAADVQLTACAGAVHRLRPLIDAAIVCAHQDQPPEILPERMPSGVPKRLVQVICRRLRLRVVSLHHATNRLHRPPHLELDVQLIEVNLADPLYPLRKILEVRMDKKASIQVEGARLSLADATAFSEQEWGTSDGMMESRPHRKLVAWISVECNTTRVLHTEGANDVVLCVTVNVNEVGMCASAPRLRLVCLLAIAAAAAGAPQHPVFPPKLVHDAFADHSAVHMDILMENLKLATFYTSNAQLHTFIIQSVRATLLQGLTEQQQEQAFLFMSPTTPNFEESPFKVFVFAQLLCEGDRRCLMVRCREISASLDPMLVSWLADWSIARDARHPDSARPMVQAAHTSGAASTSSGHHSLLHRRADASSRSHSSGEREPTPSTAHPPPAPQHVWSQRVINIMQNVCISVHVNDVELYAPMETVSALDCDSLPAAIERHISTPVYIAQSSPMVVITVEQLSLDSQSAAQMIHSLFDVENSITNLGTMDLEEFPALSTLPVKMEMKQLRCITMPPGVPDDTSHSHKRQRLANNPIVFLKPHDTTIVISVQYEDISNPHNRRVLISPTSMLLNNFFRNKAPVSPATTHGETPVVHHGTHEVSANSVMKSSFSVHIDTTEIELEAGFSQIKSIYRAAHLLYHVVQAAMPAPAAPARTGALVPTPVPSATPSAISMGGGSDQIAASPSTMISELVTSIDIPTVTVHTVVWVQWVLQQSTLRYYSDHDTRLTLAIEALSVIGEFLQRSTHYKMNMADVQLYVETKGDLWHLPNAPGAVVMRPLRDTPVPKFMNVIVTVATNTNLRTQFNSPSPRPPARAHASTLQGREVLVLEVVVTVAPLEFTLSPSLLTPFVRSITAAIRSARALCCEPRTGIGGRPPPIPTAHPLVHLTCEKVILQLPAAALQEANGDCNTVVLQIEGVNIHPLPDNPIVRQPLCPDVPMELDPTEWWDNSQDRQYIIKLGAFSVHTSTWNQLEKGRKAMAAAQDNAALAWARWGEALGPTPLLPPVLILHTLAPATNLYAAAAEFSTPQDVKVQVCMPQLRLLLTLYREMSETIVGLRKLAGIKETENKCQYREVLEVAARATGTATQEQADTIGGKGSAEIYATAKSVNFTLYEQGQLNGIVGIRFMEPSLYLTRNNIASTTNYQISVYDLFVEFLQEPEPTAEDENSDVDVEGEPKVVVNIPIVTIPILETMRGEPHPTTHVLPALLTMNVKPMNTEEGSRFEIKVAIERPVRVTLCEERARRTRRLYCILKDALLYKKKAATDEKENTELMQRIHTIFNDVLESVELKTTQLVIHLANPGTTECNSVSCGLSTLEATVARHAGGRHARGERGLHLQALAGAFAVSVPLLYQHITHSSFLLHPVTFTVNARAVWDTLPPKNNGHGKQLRLLLDAGRVTLEVAPHHPAVLSDALRRLRTFRRIAFPPSSRVGNPAVEKDRVEDVPSPETYYEDNMSAKPPLGAFRIVHTEENFPSPFEMAAGPKSVTWCYPVPRVITSIVIYPLHMASIKFALQNVPEEDDPSGIPLALEWYCEASEEFQLLGSFVLDERSHQYAPPAIHEICARIWRVRLTKPEESEEDPLDSATSEAYLTTPPSDHEDVAVEKRSIMSMVAGALHVWSRQKAREVPAKLLVMRSTTLKLHVRLPANPECAVEAMRAPRIALSVHAERGPALHVRISPAVSHIVTQLRVHMYLLDPYTMKLERMLGPSLVRVRCQRCEDATFTVRAYVHSLEVITSPHHLRMVRKLRRQWTQAELDVKQEEAEDLKWLRYNIANNTERKLLVGQLLTANAIELHPGDHRPFDWRNSSFRLKKPQRVAPHTLCISLRDIDKSAKLNLDKEGMTTLRLETGSDAVIHMNVTNRIDPCGTMQVRMEGRLHLANMTTYDLVYEVWETKPIDNNAYTGLLCSGTLPALSTDRTALCCEMDMDKLLIRYRLKRDGHLQFYWTGSVPLGVRSVSGRPDQYRERGTPWLTKLEVAEGQNAFVWNRTVHEPEPSGRLLVMVWPLYLVTSELPLDVLARVKPHTEPDAQVKQKAKSKSDPKDEPQQQQLNVPGRGATTIFPLSGTPSTVYNCTFCYRDVVASLTQEVVPLHYGLNRQPDITTPTADISTVLAELKAWVASLRNDASEQDDEEDDKPVWPYSVVSRHRACNWQPSPRPPHTDLNIEYKRVRTKSDGSGFLLVLRPQSLFCNATARTLTVRTASRNLFTVQPDHVIAPPTTFPLVAGWMVSVRVVEDGAERWMSCEMSVVGAARGPYERVPAGELAPLQPAHLHMISTDSTELMKLSLYYEMYGNMEIVGASTTLVLRNVTPDALLVGGVAIWMDELDVNYVNRSQDLQLFPRQFHLLPPHDDAGCDGMPFDLFTLQGYTKQPLSSVGHWRMFLCFSLHCPNDEEEARHEDFVPLRYNTRVLDRRTLALRAADGTYRGYTATVQRLQPEHEGRWMVEVGDERHAQYRVRNCTALPLMLATTLGVEDVEEEVQPEVMVECEGAVWERCLPAGAELLYSSPAYCAWRVAGNPDKEPPPHRLLLGTHLPESGVLYVPVEVSGSSRDAQLVRLTRDAHVKVSVQRGLCESLVTICHIESHDMSARDIRERLANSEVPAAAAPNLEVLNENVAPEPEPEPPSLPAPNAPREEKHKWDVGVFVDSTKITLQEAYGGHRNMLHLYIDATTLTVCGDRSAMDVNASVRSLQMDNAQRTESNVAYDFPVVVVAECEEVAAEAHSPPPMWTVQLPVSDPTRAWLSLDMSLLFCRHNRQTNAELYKLEVRCPYELKLYVEDKYLTALLSYCEMLRAQRRLAAAPPGCALVPRHALVLSQQLRHPLSLRELRLCEVQLDLNLRSTQWLYLALNRSPVKLNEFERVEFTTRPARLTRTLIQHYLSGAVLRAGWMIGSLEALGAPGTLVRRVGEAVRGGGALQLCGQVAAGTLDSVSTLCSSLARNLDLLTGDDEYTTLAAEQRRQRPRSLPHALVTGIAGFLGATFGGLTNLMQQPLVAPRTALLGVISKPLSAAADLVSMSTQGLLTQAGWEEHPMPRTWVNQRMKHAAPMEMTVLSNGSMVIQEHNARCAENKTIVLVTSQHIMLLNDRNEATMNIALHQMLVDPPLSPPNRVVRLRPMTQRPRPMPPQARHWDSDEDNQVEATEKRRAQFTSTLLHRRETVPDSARSLDHQRHVSFHLDSDEAELELRSLLGTLSHNEINTGFSIV